MKLSLMDTTTHNRNYGYGACSLSLGVVKVNGNEGLNPSVHHRNVCSSMEEHQLPCYIPMHKAHSPNITLLVNTNLGKEVNLLLSKYILLLHIVHIKKCNKHVLLIYYGCQGQNIIRLLSCSRNWGKKCTALHLARSKATRESVLLLKLPLQRTTFNHAAEHCCGWDYKIWQERIVSEKVMERLLSRTGDWTCPNYGSITTTST